MSPPGRTAPEPPDSWDDAEHAAEHYRERLAVERENDDRAGEAECLDNLGAIAQSQGDLDAAAEHHRESLAIKREIGDREGEANSLGNLGLVARNRADLETAAEHFERALAIQREIDDEEGEARSLANLGLVYVDQDDLPTAKEHLEQGARQLRELGVAHEAAKLIRTLVDVCEQLEYPDEAVEWCEIGMQLTGRAGDASLQRELSILYAQLSGRNVADSTTELYYHALGHLLQGRGGAASLFEEAWNRRSAIDEPTDVYPLATSAGVYLAGLSSTAGEVAADPDEIVSGIGPERHRFSEPVRALYDHLDRGETDLDPEDLRAGEADEHVAGELSVEVMERRAAALLLDRLRSESGG